MPRGRDAAGVELKRRNFANDQGVSSDPYEMLISSSDPEFDDLTNAKKMKAAGSGRRRRRENRLQD